MNNAHDLDAQENYDDVSTTDVCLSAGNFIVGLKEKYLVSYIDFIV